MRYLLAVAMFLTVNLASASTQMGFIDWVTVRADGLVYFSVSNSSGYTWIPPRTTPPACATQGFWVIRSETSMAGQMQYQALLKEGSLVIIVGTDSCTRWPDAEDVDSLQIY